MVRYIPTDPICAREYCIRCDRLVDPDLENYDYELELCEGCQELEDANDKGARNVCE